MSDEMVGVLPDEKIIALDQLIQNNNGPGAAIIILQKVQSMFGCVTPAMISRITEYTGIPESELYGIATFYSQFRLQPPGKYLIKACCGTACHLGGAEKVARAIEEYTGAAEGGTSEDGLFSLETVACLGCCSMAPVMMVNETVYGGVTPKSIQKIVRQIKSREKAEKSSIGVLEGDDK
ncbi:NADH-quinone oxidoreductase subunit NuoE [Pelotomaculum terephthalicicum JT]|uniref:NADH-quinone oxidoreductase subunit NuoE n=1 Tax=Pelotomaculum TaxID=191373 RepID=UPI0009D5AEB1|nr:MULTISPECIES: NADH-quinone oxidoreductase subunit NuoE [Pelotomaculum]MCG9968538.1 NADH-quinone oxidoreductase subunit NuoE [Pelotomaculum terephthalicicum JT]OPX85021.1 MAG: NADP-reducing hydrogenase subunit HndA [Pelotomaculum sp. PtaB.Bin117]OPY62779.1 MAG: NADP-reducing hydrogenase subunit HndA [Pelotomaculum sp. PtaU1.Bin065]